GKWRLQPVVWALVRHRFCRSARASECHGHRLLDGRGQSGRSQSGPDHRHDPVVHRLPHAHRDHDDHGGAAMRPVRKVFPLGASDRASEQGFTLIELLIAVLIFAVISLAAFSVLSTSQQASVMNDQTVQLQKNVRLAMDLIARDIRMTGYGNPPAGSVAGCAQQLNATDQAVGADTGPDSISVMTIDQQVGTLAAQAPNPPATLTNQITVSGLAAGAVAVGDVITLEGAFTASVNAVAGSALTL